MRTIYQNPTITIAIPALNEGKNIGALLESIVSQEEKGFIIENVVVMSDGSTDNTVHVAQSIHDPRVVVIDGHERLGKAVRQNEVISRSTSDILILLDGDITIVSRNFVLCLVTPILDGRADFTSGRIAPLKPKGIIDGVLAHMMRVKTHVYESYNDGDSVYSCFGPARAFSRLAYQKLQFKKLAAEDAYSYLQMKQFHMRFVSVAEAVFFVRCPSTMTDHQKQSVRFINSHSELAQVFGETYVRQVYKLPLSLTLRAILYAFIKSPFHSMMYIGIYLYMKFRASQTRESQFLWERIA